MIIVSQNKDKIINFDVTCTVRVFKTDKNKGEIFVDNYSGSEHVAIYETEERAKEVLQEFIKFYIKADLEQSMGVTEVIAMTVLRDKGAFQMPLE